MKQAIIENQQDPEKQYALPKALTTDNSAVGGSPSMMEETKQKALESIRQAQPRTGVAPRRRSAEN